MATLSLSKNRAGSVFATMIRERRFASWFEAAAGTAFRIDPWEAMACARAGANMAPPNLETLVALMVEKKRMPIDRVRADLGGAVVAWMQASHVAYEDAGYVSSELCLISRPGQNLLADWPREAPSGRLSCQNTYLSAGSYDCARYIERAGAGGVALDLGCGGGILSVLLARRANVVAIDVDPRAIWLTKLNTMIAEVEVDAQRDDWATKNLGKAQYDVIASNPPWRIVPDGICYPDSLARRGRGRDGLEQVRTVLSIVASALAKNGYAVLRFDLPYKGRRNPLADDLAALEREGIGYTLEALAEINISEQAVISADTCAALNIAESDLPRRFLEAYRERGIDHLQSVLCVLTR